MGSIGEPMEDNEPVGAYIGHMGRIRVMAELGSSAWLWNETGEVSCKLGDWTSVKIKVCRRVPLAKFRAEHGRPLCTMLVIAYIALPAPASF